MQKPTQDEKPVARKVPDLWGSIKCRLVWARNQHRAFFLVVAADAQAVKHASTDATA